MYIVKLDNKKIFDQRIDDLTLIEPVLELEENSAGSFKFTITKEHPYYDEIKRRNSIIQVYEDNDLLFSGMAYEVEEDFYCNKNVYCEGELSYLNDSIQRPAEYHGMTTRGLLEAYINNHNAQVEKGKQFKVGMVTVKDPNESIFCYTNMETTLKCIKEDLVDDLGGIIRIRYSNNERYIDYITEDDTKTNNQVIRLGENLINYKSNISSLDIATAIIPLGAKLEQSPIEALEMRLDIKSVNSNKDYIADTVAVNTFGWIYKTVTWDDVHNAQTLKQKGLKFLNDTQFDNLVIEVNAIDMHLIDKSEIPYRLSDKIRIVSKPHGLKDKYFRLTKQTIELNNPERNTITLGKEEHLSLSARTAQVNEAIYQAFEKIVAPSTILKQAKDNATALINGNGENGYVVLHENDKGVIYEILIMDTPSLSTATRVWRWNQKGFGYAKSKDANGNFKFDTAMTMDGAIVADFITSGVMSADHVRGGTLEIGGSGFGKDGSIKIKSTSGTELATLNNQGLAMKAGSINLNNNFIVDSSGSMTAKAGSIEIGKSFKVDNSGNLNASNASLNGDFSSKGSEAYCEIKNGNISGGINNSENGKLNFNFTADGVSGPKLEGYNNLTLASPKLLISTETGGHITAYTGHTGTVTVGTVKLNFKNGILV